MDETPIAECTDCLRPDEAFSVLGNETRLAILEALWETDSSPLSFSELHRATGMSDSAQFNYHLGKLRGQFVVEDGDGYDLSYAGRAVIQAVVSGTFNEQPEIEPFPVEGTCVDCNGELVASYSDEQVTIACAECETTHVRYPFPPGGLADRSRGELIRAFDQRLRHFHCLFDDGVCPHCGGTVEMAIKLDQDVLEIDTDVAVGYRCNNCETGLATTVGMTLFDNVEVVSFHRDHGIDLNERLAWTLPWVQSGEAVAVESTDPVVLSLSIELDDERLELRLDERLAIIDCERVSAATAADD